MKKLTTQEFIKKANIIHKFKYDYSKVIYIDSKTKITIICPIHGEFEQIPDSHIRGKICLKCADKQRTGRSPYTIQRFIEEANIKHNNRWDYSLIDKIEGQTKLPIKCKLHGVFWQRPSNHLTQKNGCPICKCSKGEQKIITILTTNQINFIPQYKFNNCVGTKRPLPFDFYLPDYNTCIEFDGEQHFNISRRSKTKLKNENMFKYIQINDSIKNEYCRYNEIKLIRIPYYELNNIEKILGVDYGLF